MTVSTTSNRISYNGDNTTTVFSFPYKFLDVADIKVFVGGVLQTITTNYSVGTPSDTGANITFVSAPAVGTGNVVFVRESDLLQQAALKSNGKFPAETVEDMIDKLTLIVQRQEDKFNQSLVVPDDETFAAELPDKATRAGKYLSFDAVTGDPETVNAVVDVTTVAGIASDITTVSGIAANVTTVSGIAANVTIAAANVADITNFADVYQGGKAANPALRNDGSALQDGDLYFNTVANNMRVYDSGTASWVVAFIPSTDYLQVLNNLSDLANTATARTNLGVAIGVNVQAYDADTAKTDVAQTFTARQRTNETTDNDGSFDLDVANDFKCTPTAGFALTFTNIPSTPAVQKGTILLDNSGGYAITAAATTKVTPALLATISVAGIYTLGYRTSNGNVYVTASGAQA